MSRRNPRGLREVQFVAIDIECPAGHRVGQALKVLAGPRAGQLVTGRGMRFEETPDVTPTSGRLRGRCEACGADVLVRWDRVLDRIERNEREGRHADTLRP